MVSANSYAQSIANLDAKERKRLETTLKEAGVDPDQLRTYPILARPKQYAPFLLDDYIIMVMAGRGAGKTWLAGGWICEKIRSGQVKRVGLAGKSQKDLVNVMLKALFAHFEINKMEFTHNKQLNLIKVEGVEVFYYSAERPESTRGPEHDLLWCDEIGSWPSLSTKQGVGQSMFENLMLGLRIGDNPQCLITSTPARSILFEEIRSFKYGVYKTINMSTFDNKDNLSKQFLNTLESSFKGSPLYKQEVLGQYLDAIQGALWDYNDILQATIGELTRDGNDVVETIIGIDPAMTAHERSDETGIVVASRLRNKDIVIREDATCRVKSDVWGATVVKLARKYNVKEVHIETNQGGDLVKQVLKDAGFEGKIVGVSQKMSKAERASITAQLYVLNKDPDASGVRTYHEYVTSTDKKDARALTKLESEMFTWIPEGRGKSPDRIDALGLATTKFLRKQHVMVGSRMNQGRFRGDKDKVIRNDSRSKRYVRLGRRKGNAWRSKTESTHTNSLLNGLKKNSP